jgi:hypothetical protein
MRRVEWRTKAQEGTYASFFESLACEKSKSDARVLESISEVGRFFLAPGERARPSVWF